MEAVLATALTALLVTLAIAVFLPLARASRRYHRRSDQQQQTESALERMTRMIESSKASGIRIYDNSPASYTKILQSQAIFDVGPEARTLWDGEVQFLCWQGDRLTYQRLQPTPADGEFAGLRIYHPPDEAGFLSLLQSSPPVLLCTRVRRWEIEGYSSRGMHFPLTLILETRSAQVEDEPPYSYTLRTSTRPVIRHGL